MQRLHSELSSCHTIGKSYAGKSYAGKSYAGKSYAGKSYAGKSYAGKSKQLFNNEPNHYIMVRLKVI